MFLTSFMTFSKGELRNTTLLSEKHTDNLRAHSLHNKKRRRGSDGGRRRPTQRRGVLRPREAALTLTDRHLEGGVRGN